MTPTRKQKQYGSWRVLRWLAPGGNSTVWLAEDSSSRQAALKVCRAANGDSQRLNRFADEIATMVKLRGHSGVLPLLDSYQPVRPSKGDPAWLATSLAEPIAEALGPTPSLELVVQALAAVAHTLSDLVREMGIHHRDIKPANLFRLNANWCVGDFGLVDFPGKQALTAPGRHLGPQFYIAPEMLNTPDADPGPADVYSLAKTIWVLATGQNYPLPGHLTTDIEQFLIGTFRPHSRSRPIERLIERSTHPTPARRPSMHEVAQELGAWLSPAGPVSTDMALGLVGNRIEAVLNRRDTAQDRVSRLSAGADNSCAHILTFLKALGAQLASRISIPIEYSSNGGFVSFPGLVAARSLEGVIYSRFVALSMTDPPAQETAPYHSYFSSGVGVVLTRDGQMHLQAGHMMRVRSQVTILWQSERSEAAESALQHNALSALLDGLRNSALSALDAFATALEDGQ